MSLGGKDSYGRARSSGRRGGESAEGQWDHIYNVQLPIKILRSI